MLANHIGQQNAITLAELCARTNMGERQARRAIELLVNDYSIPVGAHSGKDGRWIIDNFIGAIRLYVTVVGTTRQIIKSLAERAGYLDINKFELEQTESKAEDEQRI